MESIVLRRYKPGDENGIIELRNEVFDSTKNTNLLKWQWEYLNTPQGMSKIFLYEDNGKIVGHYGLIPILLTYRKKNILSGKSEDAMIHRKYRVYGNKFVNLVKKGNESLQDEGIDLIWGFPNKAAFLPHIKGGFTHIGNTYNLIKILDIRIILEKLLPSYIKNRFICEIIITIFAKAFSAFNIIFKLKTAKNISIKSTSKFDKRISKLWEKANSEYGITIVRNCEYLNWRFVENPNTKSKIFIAEKEDEILGYIVLGSYTSKKNQIKVGFISDLFFCKKEKKILIGLLNNAIKYFEEQCVAYISILVVKDAHDNKSFLNLFTKKGFLFKNRELTSQFILKVNSKNVDTQYVNEIKNWYITHAFGEGVRF